MHQHRTTAACHLARNRVELANRVSPVASPHRDGGELGQDDGASDGSGDLLRALNTKTNVTIVVPIVTNALNLVLWPVRVCFCTGMIFRTSFFRDAPRKKSMISDSVMGRESRSSSSKT